MRFKVKSRKCESCKCAKHGDALSKDSLSRFAEVVDQMEWLRFVIYVNLLVSVVNLVLAMLVNKLI